MRPESLNSDSPERVIRPAINKETIGSARSKPPMRMIAAAIAVPMKP